MEKKIKKKTRVRNFERKGAKKKEDDKLNEEKRK